MPFEEIDDTDPTDCKESSHKLEEDVSTWPRGISNFGGLCLRGVEHFGGFPGKLLSKVNFSPFNSWGFSPSSLLESLSNLCLNLLLHAFTPVSGSGLKPRILFEYHGSCLCSSKTK